jgi:hypothetical protein
MYTGMSLVLPQTVVTSLSGNIENYTYFKKNKIKNSDLNPIPSNYRIFSMPALCPDWNWGSPSLLTKRYEGFYH